MSRALLVASAALLAACHRHAPRVVEQPTQRLEGVKLEQSVLGSPAWKLEARQATLEQGDAVAVLAQPHVEFFKDKKLVSTLEALGGVMNTNSHDVTLSTDVVVRSVDDRTTLTTDELVYSSTKKKFLTDREVLVKRPGGTLRGRGLEASPDLTDIRIYNQRTVLEGEPR